jgi:hypothetical protein
MRVPDKTAKKAWVCTLWVSVFLGPEMPGPESMNDKTHASFLLHSSFQNVVAWWWGQTSDAGTHGCVVSMF